MAEYFPGALQHALSSSEPNSTPAGMGTNGSRYDHNSGPTLFVTDGVVTVSGENRRGRGKSTPGLEQVKHRRTRSGCFTCRARRVKCDERHPICERCAKGGRECVYPEPSPITKPRRREKPAPREGSSSLDELEEEDENQIPGENDDTFSTSKDIPWANSEESNWGEPNPVPGVTGSTGSKSGRRRKGSLYDHTPSPQPGGNFSSLHSAFMSSAHLRRSASQPSLTSASYTDKVGEELAIYLGYHQQKLTHLHYLIKSDSLKFFQHTLINYALEDKALLYAVAAFASFHYCVENKTGVVHTFLEFYNKSVRLLRESLVSKPCTLCTLLTVLELASFEEYMGDWGNLVQHRNAATEIMGQLYSPESMAQTAENRLVYSWLCRFDIYASMMAGHLAALDSTWSRKNEEALRLETMRNPEDVSVKVEHAISQLRKLAMDISFLVAQRAQGVLSQSQVDEQVIGLRRLLTDWYTGLDPSITNDPEEVSAPLGNIADEPFLPAKVYKGDRSAFSYLLLDYYALKMLMNQQLTAVTDYHKVEGECTSLAIDCCRIISGIQEPGSPPSVLLPTQAQLALIALWVPPYEPYRVWLKRQMGSLEQMGYIYPRAFRYKIAHLWSEPEIQNTWNLLPVDNNMGMLIRQLIDVRQGEYPKANDRKREEILGMRAFLSNLGQSSSGAGSPSTTVSSTLGSPQAHSNCLPQQFNSGGLTAEALVKMEFVQEVPYQDTYMDSMISEQS